MQDSNKDSHQQHQNHHHIMPNKVALTVGGALLGLTAVTVWVAGIDLGKINFLVAMIVATIKASLVALFFMNLKYDKKENAVMFVTSFLFLAIFISLTVTDVFFRGEVYVDPTKPLLRPAMAAGGPKFKKPWISTPELIAHGKEVYAQSCTACHGDTGKGDGPGAKINPPPRNFTVGEGWKNGRKPSQVFLTMKNGIPGTAMASWESLPIEDRWALTHFVLSIGPAHPEDSSADLAKAGVNPNQETVAVAQAATIPVSFAMARIQESGPKLSGDQHAVLVNPNHPGAQLYAQNCMSCHGTRGEGGIKVKTMGAFPKSYLVTSPLNEQLESMRSPERFAQVVTKGYPGDIMPGFGQLSGAEIREIYNYLKK